MAPQAELTIERGIATIALSNTERHNALSVDMIDDIGIALETAESDQGVRVVVLTGSGRSFCVGADLAAPPERRTLRRDSAAGDLARLKHAQRLAERIHTLRQPTIAAVNGACAGAGLSLALACDFRLASRRAVLNTAFLTAGLAGDLGGIWFATRILGGTRARSLFMLPGRVDASTAKDIGLISDVLDEDTFDADVRAVATRLATSAPIALQEMKRNLLTAECTPLGEYLTGEAERMVRSFHTQDAREAADAFLGKRNPVFTGS
ncbi:enoyl-CoA hydratase/isomerase family protein [Prescottella equi]|uniref:enoyl-CoA hydratase/isomerase family protein n=1 Tax=Rhodococcus hoagii TaxID=43767 RepID=UPI0023DBCDE8|nr:enoyl-CoA hydratase-related protein [Prescottella equi]